MMILERGGLLNTITEYSLTIERIKCIWGIDKYDRFRFREFIDLHMASTAASHILIRGPAQTWREPVASSVIVFAVALPIILKQSLQCLSVWNALMHSCPLACNKTWQTSRIHQARLCWVFWQLLLGCHIAQWRLSLRRCIGVSKVLHQDMMVQQLHPFLKQCFIWAAHQSVQKWWNGVLRLECFGSQVLFPLWGCFAGCCISRMSRTLSKWVWRLLTCSGWHVLLSCSNQPECCSHLSFHHEFGEFLLAGQLVKFDHCILLSIS